MPPASGSPPALVILSGPNGAGKSTSKTRLVPPDIAWVNADEIALTLDVPTGPLRDLAAGRIMLARMDELEAARATFAIETTLSSRTLAPRIRRMRQAGYVVHLFFLWIDNPDTCVQRVSKRVQSGGHDIPEQTIRQRYERGCSNLLNLYSSIVDSWWLYDNSNESELRLIATRLMAGTVQVHDPQTWSSFLEVSEHGR